jgi:biotin carboxyl carrier protein
MKQYRITVDGSTLDVKILSDPRLEEVEVEVEGRRFVIDVQRMPADSQEDAPAAALPARLAVPAATTPSGRSVTAPLPGVIKTVVAQPGQLVTVGDHLLVIEAMKMDNIIRAPRAGIIDVIHVAEGHRVAHGQPMLEYRD